MALHFGRYWLHEKIGQGGMAEVFRVTLGPDPETYSFELALKCMLPSRGDSEVQRHMFAAEAYIAKLMVHPNILRTYESGEVDGRPYLAMEHIRGVDLAGLMQALRSRGLTVPPDLGVYITLQVLRGLDYIHSAKTPAGKNMEIVHRDITPSNIYITLDGAVKIGDFGVARVTILEPHGHEGVLKGKLRYMAPEAITRHELTQRYDLWSLGAVLYEMLTGRRLHAGLSEEQVISQADAFKPPSVSDFGNLAIDKQLVQIVARMLHPVPAKRPKNAASCYRLLRRYAQTSHFAADATTLASFVVATTGRMGDLHVGERPPDYDPLTDVYSYRRTLELLQIELDRAKRYDRLFTLLFVNIDGFRAINEALGTTLGDDVLRYLARVLLPQRVGLRSTDFVGRRDADRFLVVLPETPTAGGITTAKRLQRIVAEADWQQLDARLGHSITVSVGVASYPVHGTTAGALIEAADVACYEAKTTGRNRVVAANSEFQELKMRVGDGVATSDEVARWEELVQHYQHARALPDADERRPTRVEAPIEVVLDNQRTSARIYVGDFGLGGVRLQLPFTAEPGQVVSLSLLVAGISEPVAVQGRVLWLRKNGVAELEFVELPPHARATLEALFGDAP